MISSARQIRAEHEYSSKYSRLKSAEALPAEQLDLGKLALVAAQTVINSMQRYLLARAISTRRKRVSIRATAQRRATS